MLRAGGLVAFPTETVYGLGADASNPAAVRRIFEVKGRPATHPLIVHLADAVQLSNWAREVPEHARKLARRFWPGPLTMILRRARGVSDVVTGGQDTVALRVPSHPLALQLLARFGRGIAAPSANRHGRVSATTAEHVRREFGAAVDYVLDGGATQIGIESTIIDCSGAGATLLRPGWITRREIEAALGVSLAAPPADAPRAPGTLAARSGGRTCGGARGGTGAAGPACRGARALRAAAAPRGSRVDRRAARCGGLCARALREPAPARRLGVRNDHRGTAAAVSRVGGDQRPARARGGGLRRAGRYLRTLLVTVQEKENGASGAVFPGNRFLSP